MPDYKPLDPSGLKFEEPSITDKIDMVVNESIPVAEVAELNRLKPEIESYRAELNKWNEKIYEICHQKEVLEKEKKAEKLWIC